MKVSRRSMLQTVGGMSLVGSAGGWLRTAQATGVTAPGVTAASAMNAGAAKAAKAAAPVALPDKANFEFEGTCLNAAYTHPVGKSVRQAGEAHLRSRATDGKRNWPVQNARDEAVAAYAQLINAAPTEVAVVPSTLEGENLIAASLGLGPGAGVVTDPFHYDASLVMYGELHKRGMPLTVIAPHENRIRDADLEAAITKDTRLVAVSWVSSPTAYRRDLKRICDVAHARGALVYADVIQGVGGIPLDVKACGVDFCCAGTYKYLMGDFGTAFLYVRADRLSLLKRVQVGWRQMTAMTQHFLPFDTPGSPGGEWELGTDTASRFEVSTPSWFGLGTVLASINYIQSLGVENIARHRAPLLQHLQEELPRHGFQALTPTDAQGTSVVFSYEGAYARFHEPLEQEKIYVTLTKNRVRIAPSVYNDQADIERLLKILCA